MSGSGTWGAGFWGQNQWNDLADPTFTLTGIAFSASLGDETTVGEINLGWGRLGWNEQAWGIAGTFIATGDAVTANLGTPVISLDVSPGPSTNNNQLITTNLGTVAIDIVGKVFPTGFGMTSALGTADAGPDAMATGNAMSMGLGSVQAYNQTGWGRQEWSENGWGVEGEFANVDVTGLSMTAAAGTLSMKGELVVELNTLNVAQATLGIVDPAPDASITGNLITANLGTLVGRAGAGATPSGIAMTAGLGTAVGVPGQEIVPTGHSLDARVASVSVAIHIDIQLTGFGLTMNQGSGNALIWNEVNTGSAPITPPGWSEVAA
tara:strand:- start:217 stop:1182 length:966 start_codon:yes stop_codon:yes gene_type:complete